MSYQPAKSFRNRMKHAFERLSIEVNQFSAPDMVHFNVLSNEVEMVITISDISQTNLYSTFCIFLDGGQPRIFVQSRNQRLATCLCNIGPRFRTGDFIIINQSQKNS